MARLSTLIGAFLGLLSTAIWVFEYKEIAAGKSYYAAIVALVALVFIVSGYIWNKKSTWTTFLAFAGGISAVLILIFTAVVYIPPIRHRLILLDHRYSEGIDPFTSPLGLATREQLYSKTPGLELLQDPDVQKCRLQSLSRSYSLPDSSQIRYRSDWALAYISMRLQGMSDDQIVGTDLGSELLTGLLSAEALPPSWWEHAEWLKTLMKAQPEGSFKMGILDLPTAQRLAARILTTPERLNLHVRRALLYILGKHPLLFTRAEGDKILHLFQEAVLKESEQKNNFSSLDQAIRMREIFIEDTKALAENRILRINLTYPERFSREQLEATRASILFFITACGYLPIESPQGLHLELVVDLVEFDKVVTQDFKKEKYTYSVQEQKRLKTGKNNIISSQSVERSDTRFTTEVSEGSEAVLSLLLRYNLSTNQASLTSPPFGMMLSKDLLKSSRRLYYTAGLNSSDAFDLDFYLKNYIQSPFRFGLIDYDDFVFDGKPGNF